MLVYRDIQRNFRKGVTGTTARYGAHTLKHLLNVRNAACT